MRVLLAVICLCSFNSNAQLQTNYISPYWMVSTNFLGPNYVVSNVSYYGNYAAIGQFDGSATNLGLNTGIVLTTGTISDNGGGPHGPNDQPGAGIDNGAPGYDMLTDMINGVPTFDAAVLEFDFVPSIDSITLKYVFGSEEFSEWVGSDFNDVFGIFISGPGITGIETIKLLPNGDTVSINNVNNGQNNAGPCQNCAYFMYNGSGNEAPYDGSNTYIQYDGFTKNTVAKKTGLTIGGIYHIIIAIADAGDGILDSGLFIESCETCNYAVGIEEQVVGINLYPNPALDVLFVEREDAQNGVVIIRDSRGTVVFESTINEKKSELNISELKAGIYFVSVQSGAEVVRSKVVIN